MGSALASSPQAFFGLIASARDGSRFHRPSDRGSVWVFPLRTPDRTQQTEPLQSACSPSSCFLRRSGLPSVFSRNEGPDEAKPKTACDDDTSRLVKPAGVRISTFLHARRHREVHVTLEQEACAPSQLPNGWLQLRATGNVLSFVDSRFSEESLCEQIKSFIAGVRRIDAQP